MVLTVPPSASVSAGSGTPSHTRISGVRVPPTVPSPPTSSSCSSERSRRRTNAASASSTELVK